MEYFVGVALALCVGLFTTVVRFDRDRSLYPVILVVVASYYDLFAVMGGSGALGWEIIVSVVFILTAVAGFKTNLWIVVVALVGHGLLDWHHGRLIENAGVPDWWPMFCMSYDIAAGAYLAWRLHSKKIAATNLSNFGRIIHSCVEAELAIAKSAESRGDTASAFHRLERAHVLGQRSTVQHVRVHLHMLMWGVHQRNRREISGQIMRVIGAAAGTWLGLVPHGNTGGSNVGAFTSMAIPDDLAQKMEAARSAAADIP